MFLKFHNFMKLNFTLKKMHFPTVRDILSQVHKASKVN